MSALPKCGESVEGITVPLGNPDALKAAGKQLFGVAAQIQSSSSQVAGMPSLMSSWAGPGSSTFAELTGHQATSLASTSLTVMMASTSIELAADQLEDAQQAARRAIARAKKAREEINQAKEDIRQAEADQRDAQDRMTMATVARQAAETRFFSAVSNGLVGDANAAAAIDAADAAYRAAERDLHEAERREKRARERLKEAEDDLQDARKDGQDAADDAETAGIVLQAVLRTVPPMAMAMPGAPAAGRIAAAAGIRPEEPRNVPLSEMQPPEDWPWWAKSIYKMGRGEATALAGTLALAKKAYDNPEKIPGGLARLGSNTYHDPLGTGKALIGYEELANGRYEDWFGQMGMGALMGGTTGNLASRGTRLNRVIGSPNITKLGPNAPRWGDAFAGRKVDFSKPDLGARPGSNSKVTIPANRETLATQYPNGVRFTRAGYPIFTPYAKKIVVIPEGLDGDMANDAPLANAAAGYDKTPRGFTWHHVEDGKTMELVPTKLHKPVAHTGGRAALPGQIDLVTPGSAFTPFEQTVGGAAGAGGFTASGPAAAR
jgi:A nuclease of the HNH/ENDO VII superfamily with conserved WHH